MPRLTKSNPKYRKHRASGQAFVELNGKRIYLGPHGTKASRREYDRIIAEWLQNDRKLPTTDADTTIVELAAAFWTHAKRHYVKNGRPTDEQAGIRVCLRYLRELYGTASVAEFGPLALKAIMQKMVDAGNSRGYINKNLSRLKLIFKWGVAQELVPVDVHQRLATVAGLPKGKTEAREADPVLPIDDATVDATLPHCAPIIADMIRIQRLTGMRPCEVVLLRPCDIDRTGDVWRYVPQEHKTEHHERNRLIFIGPKAQAILLPYLLRDAEAFCFVPKRKSKHGRYSSRSYRDAVHYACDKGGIDRWNPNRIRHSTGTEVRKRYGLEAAQVVLGHSKADVTQVYAERDVEKAIAVMREVG